MQAKYDKTTMATLFTDIVMSKRVWTTLHRWVGIIIGIQVLLWIAGGLYMSAVPLEWVHGKPLIDRAPIEFERDQLTSIKTLPVIDISAVQSIEWVGRLGQPILRVTAVSNLDSYYMFSADKWQQLAPLDQEAITEFAGSLYVGDGSLRSVQWLEKAPPEASGIAHPVYRVDFDDWINTTFYIHPMTADVLKVRSDLWRLFDIFWMLHIMDYDERSDFNNPLLIISAVIALFFTVTGMSLVFYWAQRSLRKRVHR